MPACAACSNKNNRKSKKNVKQKKITFHRFPHNPTKRKEWAEIMKLNPEKLNKFSVLCSNHFAESSIDRTSLAVVRLRENAVPLGDASTKNEETTHVKEINDNTKKTEVSNDDHCYNSKYFQVPTLIQPAKVNERLNIMPFSTNNEVVNVMSTNPGILLQINPAVTAPPPIQYIIQPINPTPPTVERVDRSTCVSPVRLFNSPEVVRVREAMKYMKDQYTKKIAMLQQKNRRLEKQVTDLKNLVQELHDKHLVDDVD